MKTCIRCGGEGLFDDKTITCDICTLAIEQKLEPLGANRRGYQVPVNGVWPIQSEYQKLIREMNARKFF